MTKILLLNGPPRSGKDTAGEELAEIMARSGVNARVFKFAHALKIATHGTFFGLLGVLGRDRELACDPAAFEEEKDEPSEIFFGKTPREAYIAVSELLCKPLYGKEFFGEVLARQISDGAQTEGEPYLDVAIVTDSGFASEARPLIRKFGKENVGLIRISRDGCSFDGDSRSSIFLPELGDRQADVENDSSAYDLGLACAKAVEGFFGVIRS